MSRARSNRALRSRLIHNETKGSAPAHEPSAVETLYGVTTVDIQFQLDYQWNGQTDRGFGLFLNNYSVWCKKVDVGWGWTVILDATASGNWFNSCSRDAAVGGSERLSSMRWKSALQDKRAARRITCRGMKQRDGI